MSVPGVDRGQHLRRRAEDVRGPARPRPPARPRDLGQPGLRGAPAEQQQRRRRLHRAATARSGSSAAAGPGRLRSRTSRRSSSTRRPSGTPIYVRDVAEVRFAPMIRQGAVTRDGRGEAVTATVLLLAGENGRVVVDRVKAKLDEIQRELARGRGHRLVSTTASTLINKTIATVARNLVEGGVLVIVVLLVLLGNLRAGLIVALAIPLSMLFAGNLMLYFGIAGSLMSLGAIDFGLIVDSAVIVIENCVGRLVARPARGEARSTWSARRRWRSAGRSSSAWRSSRWSTCRSWRWRGSRGRCSGRWPLTVIFALTGSLLLSLTATPVLASFFLQPGDVGARTPGRSASPSGSTSRCSSWVAAAPGRWSRSASVLMLAGDRPGRPAPRRRVHPQARRGGPCPRPDPTARRLARRGRRRHDPAGEGPAGGVPRRDPLDRQPVGPPRDRPRPGGASTPPRSTST